MIREILFRGLRKDGKGWIYGDLAQWKEKGLCAILPQQGNEWSNPYDFDVIPETVGQFTGLIDKNGNKIFEGDLIINNGRNDYNPHKVIYDDSWAAFCGVYGLLTYPLQEGEFYIGQIEVTVQLNKYYH